MRRLLLSVLLGLALAGCTQQQAPPPSPELPSSSNEGEQNMGVIQDIDLYLHDTNPTGGQAKKPTLHLHARQGTQINESTWAFQEAYAIVYNKDRKGEELVQGKAMEIWADEGRFEEGKSAYLKGNVLVKLNTMYIELSDIEWQNPDKDKAGEAHSDSPVILTDAPEQAAPTDAAQSSSGERPKPPPEAPTKLKANGLRIYPDTKEFELVGVTGTVDFGRQEQ